VRGENRPETGIDEEQARREEAVAAQTREHGHACEGDALEAPSTLPGCKRFSAGVHESGAIPARTSCRDGQGHVGSAPGS
jgi:hypothetical protein